MSGRVAFDHSMAAGFLSERELLQLKDQALAGRELVLEKKGPGSDFLGWVDLPVNYDRDEFDRIKKAAARIREDSEVFIAIGIGGSYLGARAAIEYLNGIFYNDRQRRDPKGTEIYYCGNSISTDYINELLAIIGDRDFSVNVISKSGTTTEPAIAFRILKKKLIEKYGREGAAKRIYATTDKARGALKSLADAEGYETFVIPDDVGGRFSVLTAVGLLPIAVSGADIDALMAGAAKMRELCINNDFEENDSMLYAAARNILHRKGIAVEIMANYEPRFHSMSEWWKQLFGESEGKDGKAIFPASVDLTTDLHSMGQYIQDGRRILMETVLNVQGPLSADITLEAEEGDLDGLNYLEGKTVDFVNKCAMDGTLAAHTDGRVPNFRVNIPTVCEETLGELFYFFEFACAVSGHILAINPFDQPGVEAYKKNMFTLLGKPGYSK